MMKILFLCTTDSMIWNFMVSHIKRLEQEGCTVECATSITGPYFKELQNNGLTMHEIPFKRSPYDLQNIKAYKLLRKLVKGGSYDVIFCHEPVGGAFGRIVGKAAGCKVIYMAHGFHFYKGAPLFNNIIYYTIERVLSWRTDLLITINKEDFAASQSFHAKQTLLLNGIGVDTKKFSAFEAHFFEENFNLPEGSVKLLSVGELIGRKNHATIIEAMKSFKGKDIHYFIAGEGELREKLKSRVSDYGLQNQVHFLGFCRNISELCNSCDIFVFPSVQEGLSIALMEAMSCGKPIVASNIRGNVDLIANKNGGYLIDTYDVQGYVDAIQKIIDHPELKTFMCKINQSTVLNYDIKTIENKLVDILLKKENYVLV